MKNLNETGVQEMNTRELKETDGGHGLIVFLSWGLGFAGPGGAAVGLIIGLGVSAAESGQKASPHLFIGY